MKTLITTTPLLLVPIALAGCTGRPLHQGSEVVSSHFTVSGFDAPARNG